MSPEGTQLHKTAKRKSQDAAWGRAVVLCPPNGEPGQRFGGQTPSKGASSWTQSEHGSQPRLAQYALVAHGAVALVLVILMRFVPSSSSLSIFLFGDLFPLYGILS